MLNRVLLQQAISAIREGQTTNAKRLLAQVLEHDPHNIQAWLWLTETVETDEERLYCLQKVLEIDPQHQQARQGVQRLQAKEQAQALAPERAPAEAEAADQPHDLDAVELLIAALQDEQAEARLKAAEALGEISDPRIVEPLIAALRDRSRRVRRASAKLLGKLGDLRAVKPLTVVLQDQNSSTRRAAAEALGEIGGLRAVEPLVAALQDREGDVRQAAAQALARMGNLAVEPLVAVLQGTHKTARQAAAEALAEIGQPAVELLVPVLQHWDCQVRQAAAQALDGLEWQPDAGLAGAIYWIAKAEWDRCVEMGQPAVEPLIAILQDLDSRVRQAAVKALGKIGDPRAVEPLVAVLKDKDSRVRQAAVEVLLKTGRPAVEPLVAALKRWNSQRVRQRLAEVLDKLGWQPDEDETGATYWIAKADWNRCVEIGDPAVGPLIATLRDQDSGVRWAAAEMLGELGWRPADNEIGATYWIAKSEWNRCVDIGEPAIKPLIAALWDSESWVQQAAAGALERIRTPEALAAVEEWQQLRK